MPILDGAVRYRPEECGVGMDVFAYTRAEAEKMLAAGHQLLRRALSEGQVVFRCSPAEDAPRS